MQFELRLGSYGTQKELPANSAGDTIRFFRPRRASRASVVALTQGTTPTNLTEVPIGYVDCQLKQRGALAEITDIVRAIDLFDTLETYTKTMGADAALDFDSVCSHAICSKPGTADQDGTANPIPAAQSTMYDSDSNFERFAGVANTGDSATDFATLAAATASNSKLTRAVHLGAITRLKGVGATPAVPTINGRYVALVPPELLYDVRQDATWIQAAVFNAEKLKLFKWAEFELDGAVFVEHNAPFIEYYQGTYGVYDVRGVGEDSIQNIFSALYLGEGAFGTPKLSGMKAGSDPRAPSMIINDKPDKADPLNQLVTVGWKAFYQATLLKTNEATDQFRCVQQRCKSTFV